MSRLLFLIQVSRPIVWPVLPLVYGLGMHSAQAPLTPVSILQMLLLTFPINLVGCGLNDIYDYESDVRCSRRRAIWGAVVDAEKRPLVWRWCVVFTPIIFASSFLTKNVQNIVATALLVAVAWIYSTPPVRVKERPPLDSLANGLGYFLLPFVMGYSLGADARTMPLRYYLLALCVCGVHALATAADYTADRAAGHRTLAVVYGRRAAAAIAFAAFFLTWLLAEFQGTAVRVYIPVCAAATLAATLVPTDLWITAACVVVFAGFLVAGPLHVAGF